MYCNKCGAQLNDDVKFCFKCGADVNTDGLVGENNYSSAELSANAINTKKSFGAIFLIVAISLYTIMLVMRLVSAFNPPETKFMDVLAYLMDVSDYSDYVDIARNIIPIVLSVGLMPTLIVIIGTVISISQSHRKNGFSTIGISLTQSAMVIKAIFSVIALIVCVVAAVVALPLVDKIFTEAYYEEVGEMVVDSVENAWYMILGIAAVYYSINLVYSIFAIIAAGKMKQIFKKNIQRQQSFIGLRIMNYVMAAIAAIRLAFTLFMSLVMVNANRVLGNFFENIGMWVYEPEKPLQTSFENMFKFNVFNVTALVMAIAVYILINLYIKKHVKSINNL